MLCIFSHFIIYSSVLNNLKRVLSLLGISIFLSKCWYTKHRSISLDNGIMDCVGLFKILFGKQTFTFTTSLFDVVSDLINSLNFLGFYNSSMDEKLIAKKEYLYSCNLSHTINISNSCNVTVITSYEETEEIHQTWGIISIFLMFLPGIIGGSLIMAWTCINFTWLLELHT